MDQAIAARRRFVAGNLDALLREHRPAAQEAVDQIHAALDRLAGAFVLWQQAEGRTIELCGLAGRGDLRTAPFPTDLSGLLRDLARTPATIPLPLPDREPAIR